MNALSRFMGQHVWLVGLVLAPVVGLDAFVRWVIA